jgi:predicted HD phosphohydrolase
MSVERIRRMDGAGAHQWAAAEPFGAAVDAGLADRVLQLVSTLDGMDDGFAVDQLTHGLQTATRAERAGADEQLVAAALLHDVGKVFGDENHDAVSAEILRPYVRDDVYRVVRHHQAFTARYLAPIFGGDADERARWRGEPWFGLAERFVDEWDQLSFDPDYPTATLDHFAGPVRRVFVVGAAADRSPSPNPS